VLRAVVALITNSNFAGSSTAELGKGGEDAEAPEHHGEVRGTGETRARGQPTVE
jgi:hypothetical protein